MSADAPSNPDGNDNFVTEKKKKLINANSALYLLIDQNVSKLLFALGYLTIRKGYIEVDNGINLDRSRRALLKIRGRFFGRDGD